MIGQRSLRKTTERYSDFPNTKSRVRCNEGSLAGREGWSLFWQRGGISWLLPFRQGAGLQSTCQSQQFFSAWHRHLPLAQSTTAQPFLIPHARRALHLQAAEAPPTSQWPLGAQFPVTE